MDTNKQTLQVVVDGKTYQVEISGVADGTLQVAVDGQLHQVEVNQVAAGVASVSKPTGKAAAAPAVDVALYDDDDDLVGVLENLANPNEQQVEVPEDDYAVTISPAGTDTPVFGPVEVDLEDEMSHIFYAVGSLTDGNFTLLKQEIELPDAD